MRKMIKVLIAGCFCLSFSGVFPAMAAMSLETESSMAGVAVALNNYYAGSPNPEEELAQSLSSGAVLAEAAVQSSTREEAPRVQAARSAYENVAVSRVSNYVNIRSEANTASAVVGKIYNNCAATILASVAGEGGEWYQIQSGSVKGYIKAQYFVTGAEAEALAREVGTEYATVVNTSSLRLREKPDLESKTLTLLAEGARYIVESEQGDFLKLSVDTDLEGYVFRDYVKTSVEFKEAVSLEEEAAQQEEAARRKREADEALRKLEEVKKVEAKKESQARETAAQTKAPAQTTAPKSTTAAPKETEKPTSGTTAAGSEGTIAANPQKETSAAEVEAPTTKAAPATEAKEENVSGPGGAPSGEVASATRNAIVAYAKQFLGNPYLYGGTSLTSGTDCSGFTQGIYAHFGISIGRTSRDQAANGREISTSRMQPGDLLFYASGNYINHVAMYIGGGQIIHSSSPTTGIIISPANYRTPCKVVTFLD